MNSYTIQVSETIYQSLNKQAVIENSTLEQVIERLLTQELAFMVESNGPTESTATPEDIVEALAAVNHLTTLFADVEISSLEQALNNPMLELANADLDITL